jgi:uncharacterized membrane protein YdjX (TVP38/TMEM64 family)
MACVSEMKTSGVVVGGSITGTVVLAGVGTSLVGEIFTDTSHARVMTINRERNKKNFFTIVLCMFEFPFMPDHIHHE